MADYSPNVNDLALYFANDQGTISSCWISYDVYKATKLQPASDSWKMADLLESTVPGTDSDVFYVVNLSRLLGPGEPTPVNNILPSPAGEAAAAQGASATTAAAVPQPVASDLVIIPYDDPDNAYLVPRTVYTDPNTCHPLDDNPSSAKIIVAAMNMGVVLANIPKATPATGWGCYLLSLISLNSGAVKSSTDSSRKDKSTYFGALPEVDNPVAI